MLKKNVFCAAMMTGMIFSLPEMTSAQNRPITALADTTRMPGQGPARPAVSSGPKAYSEVITSKAKTSKGMFTVHKVEDKFFFEIPAGMMGRDILVVNRISKSAAGSRSVGGGYAGDQIGKNVIRFEKGPNNKVFLKNISYEEMSKDSTNDMYRSVLNSNLHPISSSFDIKVLATDSTGTVIELTDYIASDNDILFFSSQAKRSFNLSAYQSDKSYIESVRSFPNNIEIKTVKTYLRTAAATGFGGGSAPAIPGAGGAGTPTTYELNSSMVVLPKEPMRPRYFDARVGFFATGYTDFDANPQGVKRVSMSTRWKLEPKPEDVQKYLRGELVEPQKPIIFYIDPSTPKKWVSYLIQGVNDWQISFEKAGFKNAIFAKEAPSAKEDPSWSLEDARYSAIVYKPSDVANASGPHVNDPRSGEILESHINWYHNVMSLLRNWYFVQTAAVDAKARKMQFDDELMGQLIRFVSSHEVGHTLGLRHNFGSSSTVPVEKLRDKAFVEANGHTPSIMDYARFNYVAQPEDNISQKGLFPRIGDYDMWAIEWGYRWMPQVKSAEEETSILNKLVIDKLKNKRLIFGTESDQDDSRNQSEDLGDNAMKASAYGIKNLQRIIPNLIEWTKESDKDYSNLREMYGQVTSQFNRYVGHVSKNIGGIMNTPKTVEQPGAVYEFNPRTTQKEAMKFLQEQVFTTPHWLFDNKINSLIGNSSQTVFSSAQDASLNRLIGASTFNKLLRFEAESPKDAYTLDEMITDLRKGIWSELASHKPIDQYRRNLQKYFVEKMGDILEPSSPNIITIGGGGGFFQATASISKNSDAISITKAQLRILASEIRSSLPAYSDNKTKYHLQDVLERINDILNPKK